MRVLRLCSVFEAPEETTRGKGSLFDPIGGMQNHAGELTRALDRHGVAQTVITTRPPGAPRSHIVGERARIIRLGLPIRKFRQLYCVPAFVSALKAVGDADVVHAHLGEDLAILPIALSAARASRLPLVVSVHCSLRHTLGVVDARTALLKTLGGWIEKRAEGAADAIVSMTPRLADSLVGEGIKPEKVHVIPPGVGSAFFGARRDFPFEGIPRPRVVFLGRLARGKGIHLLLDAAAIMSTPAHVVLVGDGPERHAVRQRIEELGLSERVHVCGFVPHDDVPAVLSGADVLVLPSLFEEFGATSIEAMQMAVPVVATSVGGIPDVVHDGQEGLLVPPRDARALADALDEVLTDPLLARRLGEAGHRRARDYDWNVLVLRVLALYQQVLESSAHSRR